MQSLDDNTRLAVWPQPFPLPRLVWLLILIFILCSLPWMLILMALLAWVLAELFLIWIAIRPFIPVKN